MTAPETIFLHMAVFSVAALYASVGHGGASGYLAILSLLSYSKDVAIPNALVLNILVSCTALAAFARAKHFHWNVTWPFIAASIPAAYVGGLLKISAAAYSNILAGALFLAALRMWFELPQKPQGASPQCPPRLPAFAIGAGIGLLSGMIGIGGGVFLSPILLLSGWANAKQAAATSACFIMVNSVAGLAGCWSHGGVAPAFLKAPLILAAFVGGYLGSRLGAGQLSYSAVRRALSLVLFTAGLKLVGAAL